MKFFLRGILKIGVHIQYRSENGVDIVMKLKIQHLLSFLLVSIGLMTTMTLGFVPLINILEAYSFSTIYLTCYWAPFGISCIILGFFIDKVKKANRKYLCFSYCLWGFVIFGLIYTIPNLTYILTFVILAAIVTAVNTILAASYISAHIQMNRRGLYTSLYLGIGWLFVAASAYLSYLNLFLNLAVLAIANISVGLLSFLIFDSNKAELSWEQKLVIPRHYNVKRNGAIFYFSTLVFGIFLGIIVFLLGTVGNFDPGSASIYLENIESYHQMVTDFGFWPYLTNFDFLVIGGMTALMCPTIGKLMDKYGRKPIFFAANLAIPAVLVMFSFWNIEIFMYISVVLYALIVTVFVVINSNVWSDLAPEKKVARFNGYGWSSLGLGGTLGYLLGMFITSEAYIAYIDVLVLIAILLVSELSVIPFVLMKESLLPSEELEWRNEIIHLYVISSGGIVLSDYSFKESTGDKDLLAGGISGVLTILKEIVGSAEQLKGIDHEDKKLLFEYSYTQTFLVALLANKDLTILRSKLKKLTAQIQAVFWEILMNWDGNLDILAPIKTMIRNHFVED